MIETNCEIVFRGKILAGFDRAQVCVNLAQILGLAPAAVEAMLDAPKTVLKSGLDKQAAAQFRERMLGAGIMVAVITQPGAPTASDSGSPDAAPAASVVDSPALELALSDLSLSQLGTALADKRAFEAPKVNLKGLRLSRSNAPLESRPVVATPELKVPDLPLADLEPEREKVFGKLAIELTRDGRRS